LLSAGGGEYRPDDKNTNLPEDTHREAQIFEPPYLFRGTRPVITSAPDSVHYGETFEIEVSDATAIGKVSWIRLPSVTHAFDQNQHAHFPQFTQTDTNRWEVASPARPELCPPCHYMMFVLNENAVPSKAKIIQLSTAHGAAPELERAAAVAAGVVPPLAAESAVPSGRLTAPSGGAYGYETVSVPAGTSVTIGITGTCPYGIGACWGGAYDALGRLEAVHSVNPVPNTHDSTAQVSLTDWGLPPLDRWAEQFQRRANGTYQLRGFEATVRGAVTERDGQLFLKAIQQRPQVQLAPLSIAKVQWDRERAAPRQPEESEIRAYSDLVERDAHGDQQVTVTGPLTQTATGYQLHVRLVET
jgi:hypothetical protein